MDYTYLIHTKNQHRLIRLVASLLLDHMVERQVLMVYKASTPNNMSGTWLKTELNLIENQNIICVVTLGASSRFFVDGFFFGFFWPPFLLAGLFEGLLDSSPTFKMSPKSNPCPSPLHLHRHHRRLARHHGLPPALHPRHHHHPA